MQQGNFTTGRSRGNIKKNFDLFFYRGGLGLKNEHFNWVKGIKSIKVLNKID